MKVLLRADAGTRQGTGHVMRCLTLAEALTAQGHTAELMTGPLDVAWLQRTVMSSKITVHKCEPHEIPIARIVGLAPDWVVVDSYEADAVRVSLLDEHVPVLAIIDGDDRDIKATYYLDQNLGAELATRPSNVTEHIMAGADFALVRDAVLQERREKPWLPRSQGLSVLSFMGGTDPTAASARIIHALSSFKHSFALTAIVAAEHFDQLRDQYRDIEGLHILSPTPLLPQLIGSADVVVTSASTSAWDICTLGIPAIIVALVENQRIPLVEATSRGLTLGINAIDNPSSLEEEVGLLTAGLLSDVSLRHKLSTTCASIFDGRGKQRVVAQLEQLLSSRDAG
jgi:spore coat polysaccharide biosynthesis predicted glycosyltransferase SpsG